MDASQLFREAVELQRKGELAAAERLYVRVLETHPDHLDTLRLLGFVRYQQGRFADALASTGVALRLSPDSPSILLSHAAALDALSRREEALTYYDKALSFAPDSTEALFNRGIALLHLRRPAEAAASFERLLAISPDDADAHGHRGSALRELNRPLEALASYDRALAIRREDADLLSNRGNALQDLERSAEAIASYDRALAVRPDHVESLCNRGIALQELERPEDALASYDRAVAIRPDHFKALYNRGIALQALGRFQEALASHEAALAICPDHVEALCHRGLALQALERFPEALASYDRALVIRPDCLEALSNRAIALQKLGRFQEALASCDKAIALRGDSAEAFTGRGYLFMQEGRWAEAVGDFGRATALKPNFAYGKFAACMAELPILYDSEAEIAVRRAAYRKSLEALIGEADRQGATPQWFDVAGSAQPFLLAYQGCNDRDLASLYGSLMCRIMARRYAPAAPPRVPRSGEPVRLGIVSAFFREHANWRIPINGWLSQIDRRRFALFGYHTGVNTDHATKQAAALCDRFVQGPLSLDGWRAAILRDAPHVLIYPEIGMNAVAARLAAQRLAPVQCNSWGHPVTSGFPTLDYYLSSDLMEPQDAQNHYTERLVRLPNLSIYYEPPELSVAPLDRAALGLRPAATVFWCGQSLYKYLPQFDQVFPRIARQAGDCQFVFIQYDKATHPNRQFRERLARAFAAFDLASEDYCVMLPRLGMAEFVAAMKQCDVVLDSIGWSGCNSTFDALRNDLPIVTLPGELMRGRHTMAILKMMNMEETSAVKIDDYVSIAGRLALDRNWRMATRDRISRNKHLVYHDRACISGLEKFLESVARQRGDAGDVNAS
jgi:protein O-GlcNAc transferase